MAKKKKLLREQQDDTDWKLVAEQRAETINELLIAKQKAGQRNADLAHLLGVAEKFRDEHGTKLANFEEKVSILESHCTTYVATIEGLEEEIEALKFDLVKEQGLHDICDNQTETLEAREIIIRYLETRLETILKAT